MSQLDVDTVAQERFARDVLAWGGPRPRIPDGLLETLIERLERPVRAFGDELRVVRAVQGRAISIGRRVLERRVCDGWQLDPEPFRHSWASARAALAREAVAADWGTPRATASEDVVAGVWHDAATRRPGDPSSLSAYLNRRSPDEARALRAEVERLLDDVREVWPTISPPSVVTAAVRRGVEVPLGDGLVTLFAAPDLVLDSHVRDDRARALVIDLRTGAAQPERDRAALRFHALVVALAHGRPPFRWASFHVTEGRSEVEALDPDVLVSTADDVADTLRQLARIARPDPARPPPSEAGLSLTAGAWCEDCRRRTGCSVAAAARAVR